MALFSRRTRSGLALDLLRLKTRAIHSLLPSPAIKHDKLHIGCGRRLVGGWHNVDLIGGDERVDFGSHLPWPSGRFTDAIAQQVIEHLDLRDHLPLFLAELQRVLRAGGRAWLSCPDMAKFCSGYLKDRCAALLEARHQRYPLWWKARFPTQHMMNEAFHQDGQHINIFDHDFLVAEVLRAGFSSARPSSEEELLQAHPGFPRRNDHDMSLYVMATA